MAPILSLVVRRELENLDKDIESRRSAMKALKAYVKGLDTKAIPFFLAQVSETKEPGSYTGDYTISLYEVLARVHGQSMVPHIDNIMSTVIKTLSTGSGSFPLQQACAKVALAMARYGIGPTSSGTEKTRVICSICKPLSDVLTCSRVSIASGAAICLKALVECNNWRFASDDLLNGVCLKVAGALEEELTQTSAHMGLAVALLKHNAVIVEPYALSLICSGLQILFPGLKESNSQKRLSAVQLINFSMKCVDTSSISSKLDKVIDSLERCQSDPMPFVRGAALEALRTARMISGQKVPKHERSLSQRYLRERSPSPVIGFSFDARSGRINSWISSHDVSTNSDGPPTEFPSPGSRSAVSLFDNDSFLDSPKSSGKSSDCDYGKRANRKLWIHDGNHIDMEAHNQLLHSVNSGYDRKQNGELSERKGDLENSSGFIRTSANTVVKQESESSPQLMAPLPASSTSGTECFSGEMTGYAMNSWSDEVGCGTDKNLNCEFRRRQQGTIQDRELPESNLVESNDSNLSSATARAIETSLITGSENHIHNPRLKSKRECRKATIGLMVCFFFFLVISSALVWIENNKAAHVVPT